MTTGINISHTIRARGGRGVTLIELLIVVVMIGILLSLINASYADFYRRVATKGFAAAIVAKGHEAKSLTRSLSRDVQMKIDLAGSRVWLQVDSKVIGSTIAPSVSTIEIKGFTHNQNSGDFVDVSDVSMVTVTFTAHNTLNFSSPLSTGPVGGYPVLHIGKKTATYGAVAANKNDFQSVMFSPTSLNLMAFQEGCVGVFAWTTYFTDPWAMCHSL